MIKKFNGYLVTKSINHKFLTKVRPFKAAKTTDIQDHLKPTSRDFSPDLFIVRVGNNDLPQNKIGKEVAEKIENLAESVKKPAQTL